MIRTRPLLKWALPLLAGSVLTSVGSAQTPTIVPGKDIDLKQKLGDQVPLDVEFIDDSGAKVKLGDYFGKKPVVITLIFYRCQATCRMIQEGIVKVFNNMKLIEPGKDFEFVVVSINPKETPELARAKKAEMTEHYRNPKTRDSWHYLVGSLDNIRSVADSLGYKFYYNPDRDQISHPSAIMVLTPEGKISQYLYGVGYPQKFLADAIVRAKDNKIGDKAEEFLFGCLVYDPKTGKLRIQIENLLKITGIMTALTLAGMITFLSRKYKFGPVESGTPDKK